MEKAYLSGETALHLIPQGTFAENIRCCGAGVPAFYTPTGLNTLYAEGKLPTKYDSNGNVLKYNEAREVRTFNGKEYLLEEAFPTADFAWIKAWKADKMGNCVFKGTSYNYNRIMANAARITIVEAEEIVELGELPAESIHLPGLNVNRLFKGKKWGKIEVLHNDDDSKESKEKSVRDVIAQRAAKEFVPGSSCNLGVGMPVLASDYASKDGRHVYVQSENAIIGVGGYPKRGEKQSDWINAGKETIVPIPGASTFGSDVAFGQIRGGHLDMTVLGALECSQYGDVANYMIPGKMVKGMGGAMDLVANREATKIMVVQTHCDKHGNPKIKAKCDLPLTGSRCVHMIITELACFDVDHEKGLTLRDHNPNTSIEEIKSKTGCDFKVAEGCGPWKV
ncbi:hypothetical protein M409DRAFT_52751 [Zasmidium cellare ATCC 36951]|uniref:Succinyl-CoA:3-ketoacid-coenzyme A transferase n=1 Tax=Zasmidium cellare ATCC 36951 TaxID=1080233 RepID=A0A6A6CRF5_ZASCE|nr:uncharacterized protein M409DRAFT_52751 [Zasmidium cellare ATCC 36951]KAF2168720.1 hypothetical protein M409DRAFT_52751 [Zasmidium cellare ATCC 36951]